MIIAKDNNWQLEDLFVALYIRHTGPCKGKRGVQYFWPDAEEYERRVCQNCRESIPSGLEAMYWLVKMVR